MSVVIIEQGYWHRIGRINELMERLIADSQRGLPDAEIIHNVRLAYDKILWDYEHETGIDFLNPKIYTDENES
jgi:hypothetical protein